MSARRNLVLGGALVAALAALVAFGVARRGNATPSKYTIGDIRSVHAEVTVGAREIRGAARIADGDTVVTGPDGRARVRLDDGTLVVVDASTTLALRGTKLVLAEGRLFVQGSTASRSEVTLGDAVTTVSASAAAFERRRAQAPDRIYCAQGELVVASGGHQERVASGETATLDPSGPKVAPEAAFDDWTGGLAVPWTGEAGQASAVPEISDGTTPLVVRQAKIDVTLHGEVASTRTRVRYWNGGDHDVTGAIRLTVPPGAILSRVARGSEQGPDAEALVLPGNRELTGGAALGRLEWAGGSTLRGQLLGIAAGQTVDLVVEYVEWLSIRNGRATYRFPLASGGDPPLVSDLVFSADAAKAGSPWVSASAGTTIEGQTVATHRADARPTGDLVVELSPNVVHAGAARAYVTPGEAGEDPYVLVRTEAPEATDTSVSLALVVDTSSSVGASALEMERSVVDAVMEGLGPRDGLVVFAADQTVRPIGPATPGPVTPERRAAIRRELASVRAFGASNLGAALEVAADTLDAARPGGGMVVYLGDGRPTMGEPDARTLRKRLARRASGMPRVGAVAVTAAADRFLLARLVAGVGPVYEVVDRAEAARVGAALLADALEPTLRDVDLDLGSTIDRIYPREAHVSLSGSTVTVVGRLRGRLPDHIGFRFRRGTELVQESRRLESVSAPPFADVPKRWAAARIEEMSARGDGLEPAIALATRAKLLTPWTGFYFADTGVTAPQPSLPFPSRVFGLSPALDAPFAAHVAKPEPVASVLIEPRAAFGGGVTLLEAAAASARRTIDGARRSIIACRDARAQVRPEIADALRIEVVIGKDGHATRVRVTPADRGGDDVVLDRCVEAVVSSLPFFDANAEVKLEHDVLLPRGRGTRQTVCSEVSRLPFVVRRTIWQGRLQQNTLDFVTAARACELPSWRDRRELLTLLLEGKKGPEALSLASSLEAAGEADAAAFVQKEAFRRVANVAELEALRSIVLRDEPDVDDEFERAYAAAKTDEARLAVVRRFLLIAPHGALVRRRLIALLEALGKRDALVQEIERIRSDPFADAGLLALGASALRRAGHDDEGRRAFGELVERAPGDPWTLAYVGDHLRAEGLFDDAVAAYDTLGHLLPNDPAAILRLGLAHAGAGRLDVATRLLDRVAQTGGRGDDGSLGELASITEAVLIAGARRGSPGPDAEAELVRRLMQTPLPDVGSVVVVQSAPSDDPVEVRVVRGDRGRDEDPADLDAASMGLSVVRIERGDGTAKIHLVRRADVGPTRLAKASVSVLVIGEDRAESKLITRDVDVASGGTGVELSFDGVTLL